jgi:DNA-directed RNA polymerase subunit L
MSSKSGQGKSTEINTTEDIQINEILLNKINKILKIVLEENKTLKNYKEKLTQQKNMAFTSYNKPSLSIKDYLYRIQTYSEAEDNTIIIGLMYIDRICEHSSVILTPYNIHRIIFVSILMAIKYNEDVCFDYEFYAKIAGLSMKELKALENEYIDLIKFHFFVKKEDFDKYKLYIEDIEMESNKK